MLKLNDLDIIFKLESLKIGVPLTSEEAKKLANSIGEIDPTDAAIHLAIRTYALSRDSGMQSRAIA